MSFSKRRTTVAAAASLVFAATTLPAFVHADGADAAYSWQTPSQPWQNGQIGFNNCIQRYGSYNQTGMCNTRECCICSRAPSILTCSERNA
ncbi:hypothetical protein K437DRAFT_254474 [Tilletiaria anomala UBC 951]|uniref:Secreted protein n=1 Tax=Tilletiaria anomala (strain ATCC 24038 / CBS 436.72 / UBC 951) TaxID=1037660 RepID=A0A066WNU4_TILAU|nr:uncharacterized protein K437DRAFT_254474 [Tilletiaria anomala UBC 951]KDN52280.1 hypothetical protein K437DRAFT_254474 [Tilletiaria anomala UBC 951]